MGMIEKVNWELIEQDKEKWHEFKTFCFSSGLNMFQLLDYDKVILCKSFELPTQLNNVIRVIGYDVTFETEFQGIAKDQLRAKLEKMLQDKGETFIYNHNIAYEIIKFS